MALSGFQSDYHVEDIILNVVICVNQAVGYYHKSSINHMLEIVQRELKEELKHYDIINVAYVYEAPQLNVLSFTELTDDAPTYYKEPCEKGEAHSLKHILLMGLVLLEGQQKRCPGESRLYLLSDERPDRISENTIFSRLDDRVIVNRRFSTLQFEPILITNQHMGRDGVFEQFFLTNNGNIRSIDSTVS